MDKKHIIEDLKKDQIDLVLLWDVLRGNFIKIGIVAVLLAGIFGMYRYTNAMPYYSVKTTFLLNGVQPLKDAEGRDYAGYATGSSGMSLASMYAFNAPGIVSSDPSINNIMEYLVEEYGDTYKYMNRSGVKSMLSISVDQQYVTIDISGPDRKLVLDVANAVAGTFPETMNSIYGIRNSEKVEDENGEEVTDADETDDKSNDPIYIANVLQFPADDLVTMQGRQSTLYAAIGFATGAIVVYLFCLFRTYFDNTVYSDEDLKNRFTIPVVGQIPSWANTKAGERAFQDKSRKRRAKGAKDAKRPNNGNMMSDRDYDGRLLNKNTPFAVAEAFKTLRTNLCYTTKGETCPVYGITSAYVSAGKSLIISNIAVSFAQMNKRVLLVDADLRCPVQHKIFGLDNKVHGLSDLLAGICTFDDLYLRNGGFANLDIITTGKIPPNPAELLASDNMVKFIEMVRRNYDVVLVDLPPVCEVSDAGVVSDLLTGFVVVVRAGYSDRRMIEKAVESMEAFDASFVGFVLNDIDIKSGDYYKNKYYRGYNRRYGSGGYYRSPKLGRGAYSKGYNRAYAGYSAGYGSNYSQAYDDIASDEASSQAKQQNTQSKEASRKSKDA